MSADYAETSVVFHHLLLRVLLVLMLVGTLWMLHLFGRVLPGACWLAVLALFAALIAYGGWRRKRCRRAAWLAVYLHAASPWQRRLQGGSLMMAGQLCLGVFWAMVLGVGVLRLQGVTAWWLLLVNLPLLAIIHAVVSMLSRTQVAPAMLSEWSWRISLMILAAAVIPSMAWQAWYVSYPVFADVSLERALWHMMEQERAYSALVQNLMQLAAAKDALRLWLAEQWMPSLATAVGKIVVWGWVVLDQALLVWPCLLLCQGALRWADPDDS